MEFSNRFVLSGFLLVLLVTLVPGTVLAQGKVDVYVLYSPSQTKSMETAQKLVEYFPEDLRHQDVNIDPFALGGDQARKKAIGRVKEADYAILVNSNPVTIFSGFAFMNDVIILETAERSLKSEGHSILNVVDSSTEIGDEFNVLAIDSFSKLRNQDDFSDVDYIQVRESGDLSVLTALASFLETQLD
jgi:hypothetical protein